MQHLFRMDVPEPIGELHKVAHHFVLIEELFGVGGRLVPSLGEQLGKVAMRPVLHQDTKVVGLRPRRIVAHHVDVHQPVERARLELDLVSIGLAGGTECGALERVPLPRDAVLHEPHLAETASAQLLSGCEACLKVLGAGWKRIWRRVGGRQHRISQRVPPEARACVGR